MKGTKEEMSVENGTKYYTRTVFFKIPTDSSSSENPVDIVFHYLDHILEKNEHKNVITECSFDPIFVKIKTNDKEKTTDIARKVCRYIKRWKGYEFEAVCGSSIPESLRHFSA